MAAGNFTPFDIYKDKLPLNKINWLTDTLKVALCTNAQTLGAGFLGSSGDARFADLTAELAATGGYAAGGAALAGVAVNSYVASATVNAGGTGGTNGTQTVTGTTGTGTKFQASVTIAGNTITAVLSITVQGSYSALPTDITQEPVTGASLTGAKLSLVMGAVITATASAWAAATFIAKYAVIYSNTATNKDLIGFLDLETLVGTGISVTGSTFTVTWNANGILTIL